MANVTATLAADFIPELWAASALGKLKANTVMARLVNRDYENLVANQGDIVHVPKRGTLSVNNKTADQVVTLQTPASDKVDITLNKHKEVSFLVEDVAKAQANQDIIAGYIGDGILAIAEQIDADLLALWDDVTPSAIVATGGIAVADVVEARRVLNANKAPQEGRQIVWHEDAEAEILNLEAFTSAQWAPANADALERAMIAQKFGFTHYMDQQVVVDNSVCENIAFHRDAFALVMRPLPAVPDGFGARSVNMSEDGFGVRVTYSYNPAYLGIQVTLDVLYGVGVLRPEFAVVIGSDEAS